MKHVTGMAPDDCRLLIDRAENIEPQALLTGVSERAAIAMAEAVKSYCRGKVRVTRSRRVATPQVNQRQSIPERVRSEVWRRDDGACVDCGSRERLEFDHIIPVSKGGANTARNIELRCEECNRKKGATI